MFKLESYITPIILSQVDTEEKPMCGIYFNLSSPYHRQKKAELAADNR